MMAPWPEDVSLIAWYIAVLVFLEGLLSADNALVLALMVRHLARHDRRRVFSGASGARSASERSPCSVGVPAQVLVLQGRRGPYLLYLAISHFWSRRHSAAGRSRGNRRCPRLVSWLLGNRFRGDDRRHRFLDRLDRRGGRYGRRLSRSIRRPGKHFIVLTGGVLGIITMRFVVRYFVSCSIVSPGWPKVPTSSSRGSD